MYESHAGPESLRVCISALLLQQNTASCFEMQLSKIHRKGTIYVVNGEVHILDHWPPLTETTFSQQPHE